MRSTVNRCPDRCLPLPGRRLTPLQIQLPLKHSTTHPNITKYRTFATVRTPAKRRRIPASTHQVGSVAIIHARPGGTEERNSACACRTPGSSCC